MEPIDEGREGRGQGLPWPQLTVRPGVATGPRSLVKTNAVAKGPRSKRQGIPGGNFGETVNVTGDRWRKTKNGVGTRRAPEPRAFC